MSDSRAARSRDDRGFTLVELMVVVVVIGVLLAVGVPTLLGARHRASDAAAKAVAAQALKSQKVVYSSATQSYGDADDLKSVEPNLDAVDYAPGEVPQVRGRVYVRNEAGATATMASLSSSGKCFWTQVQNGITSYAQNDCSEEPAASEFGSSW